MIFFALYMLALCLPIALFAVISIVDDHKKAPQKAPKPHRAPTPRGALQHRQSLAPASDALIAVLEAQFLVAPSTAVREAQRLLSDATGEPQPPLESQLNHESFERLLDRLARAARTRRLLSAR